MQERAKIKIVFYFIKSHKSQINHTVEIKTPLSLQTPIKLFAVSLYDSNCKNFLNTILKWIEIVM